MQSLLLFFVLLSISSLSSAFPPFTDGLLQREVTFPAASYTVSPSASSSVSQRVYPSASSSASVAVPPSDYLKSLSVLSRQQDARADSIMERVRFFAPFYDGLVDGYKARLYIKGEIDVARKNILLRFVPHMFRLRKGERQYLVETMSDLNYTAPDLFDQKVKASVGTVRKFWNVDGRLPEYFQVKVYASTLLNDKLISPLSADAPRYYSYRLDSVSGPSHNRTFRIHFTPRHRSYQLVEGSVVVSEHVWSVRELCFDVRSEFNTWQMEVKMGEVGQNNEFLPVQIGLTGLFHFLGNRIGHSYLSNLEYQEIVPHDPSRKLNPSKSSRYDLTSSYVLRTDTNAYRQDTSYFASLRPLPLTPGEEAIYQRHFRRADTLYHLRNNQQSGVSWAQVGDALIESNTLQLRNMGSLRFSPILNPLMLSYSPSNGLSYSHRLRYQCLLPHDRMIYISPYAGYNFKQKTFYWRINGSFDYLPSKRMALKAEVGNGNRIYSSRMLEELKDQPDSIFNFNRFNMLYYRDLYFKLRNSWEMVNGLTLELTLAMHRRTEDREQRRSQLQALKEAGILIGTIPRPNLEMLNAYNSFAPGVRLVWTPGQYYYMHGKRKVNLHSNYPTISVEWERGVKGVLPNSGEYERVEVDYQHQLKLSPMRNLYYRMGWGAFTKQQSIYFVDFTNFRRSNLPTGWNDDMGGVFQLLDGRWYNASRDYLRANFTYEAPFLLLCSHNRFTKHVLNERLYFGILKVPHLNPYVEAGYGIGTHIFDFGFFTGFANGKYREMGVKFTFELFNR